jgi:hypothetical protein
MILGIVTAVLVAAVVVLVASLNGGNRTEERAGSPVFVDASVTTRTPVPSGTVSPTPSPPATPAPVPTKAPSKLPTKKVSPSKPAHTVTAAPTVPPPPGCAGFEGTNLSRAQVRALLESGAMMDIWSTVATPAGLQPLPSIKIPLNLLKAIAYQESGWQSACKANDHIGFGLFQVSADTQDFINTRFEESYDRFVPADNVKIAAAYLSWLVVYFGGYYFDEHYTLDNGDLLDAVIASFNVGDGAVGLSDPDRIVIPNPQYVSAVLSEMQPDCECQSW